MRPGDKILVDNATNAVVRERFDCAHYISWRDGFHVFRHKTLDEIARDLERMFDVQIVIRDTSLLGEEYFATFASGWEIDELLDALNIHHTLHIQRDGIWPNCYECQLWNGKAGDLIHSSGTESAELRADSTLIILPKLEPSTEKPVGEWNTAEIVCSDSTITVHVNGRLQNRLTGLSNRQGFIGLQSEGGPVQFRNIILTPLD